MPSGVKEEKTGPFLSHPVKEINDRRLYLIEFLFFISPFPASLLSASTTLSCYFIASILSCLHSVCSY